MAHRAVAGLLLSTSTRPPATFSSSIWARTCRGCMPLLEVLGAAYGEGGRVGPAELGPFLGEEGGAPPWDLTDALDKGDVATAVRVAHRLLGAGGRHPFQLLSTLHRHYGAMLRLDGSGVDRPRSSRIGLLSMAAYPARKVLDQGRKLGPERIGRAVSLIADADLDLRGVIDWPAELVIEVLVARLAQLARTRSVAPAGVQRSARALVRRHGPGPGDGTVGAPRARPGRRRRGWRAPALAASGTSPGGGSSRVAASVKVEPNRPRDRDRPGQRGADRRFAAASPAGRRHPRARKAAPGQARPASPGSSTRSTAPSTTCMGSRPSRSRSQRRWTGGSVAGVVHNPVTGESVRRRRGAGRVASNGVEAPARGHRRGRLARRSWEPVSRTMPSDVPPRHACSRSLLPAVRGHPPGRRGRARPLLRSPAAASTPTTKPGSSRGILLPGRLIAREAGATVTAPRRADGRSSDGGGRGARPRETRSSSCSSAAAPS